MLMSRSRHRTGNAHTVNDPGCYGQVSLEGGETRYGASECREP
jgi:hypothetical protein